MAIVWWILEIFSILVFVVLCQIVLPKIFFKASSINAPPLDRGIARYAHKDASVLVFEPQPKHRDFINQYILSDTKGKKVFLCKVNKNIRSLDYSIIAYNQSDKPLRSIRIREGFLASDVSRRVNLPAATAYIALTVNAANGCAVCGEFAESSKVRRIIFAFLVFALSIGEAFLIKACAIGKHVDLILVGLMKDALSSMIAVALGAVIAAANCFFTFVRYEDRALGGRANEQ